MAKKVRLGELPIEDLKAKLAEVQNEYFELRCRAVTSHLENPVLLRTLRREIAALNTFIRAKELACDVSGK